MKEQFDEEGMRRVRWAQRKEEMRREKQRQALFRKASKVGIAAIAVIVVILVVIGRRNDAKNQDDGVALAAEKEPLAVVETGSVSTEGMQTEGVEDTRTGDAGKMQTKSAEDMQTKSAGNVEADRAMGLEDADSKKGGEAGISVQYGIDKDESGDVNNIIGIPLSYQYKTTEDTRQLGTDIISSHAIFVDIEKGNILASRDETSRINPASMTKVLTLLVAVENIDNLNDTFKITSEITDYCFVNDCSNAGFEKEEMVTIKDLLYGTILPSGADAALGLATYVAGSQEAFVDMMNKKLKELGLSGSAHFTNCVGIYDENHYCTVSDMAVIMEAAMENEICQEVLSAHTYTTSETKQHPEGIILSNWFLRRIEDKETGGEVVCGKTGYVVQSGNCAVSYGVDEKGKKYICVTTNANSGWNCIYDHVKIYKQFMG